MKKIIAFFITLFILVGGAIPVSASNQAPAFRNVFFDFTEYTTEFKPDLPFEKEGGDYYVDKTVIVKEDLTFPKDAKLYIRKGGTLVIEKGASFTMQKTHGFTIERGGSILVKNGTFTVSGSLSVSYGTIEVRKKGSLIFTGGSSFQSNAGSRLVADGEVVFGELRLSDLVERILKYDKNFSLDSYCIRATDCGRYRTVFCNYDIILNYCIGDIETDYYYKSKNDTAHPKLTRRNYSLTRVYNKQRAEKLKKAAQKYVDENDYYRYYDDPTFFEINLGFMYSYRTRTLEAMMTGFQYGYSGNGEPDDAVYVDKMIEEVIGRV